MVMRYFAVALLVVLAGAAHALDIEVAGPGAVGPRVTCPGEVQFEQLPNGVSAIASQEDVCYPFLFEAADDFTGTGEPITAVTWWGIYWGGGGNMGPMDAFHIKIYTMSSGGCPEDLIFSQTSLDFTEDLEGPSASYCAQLWAPFQSDLGATYEFSIVGSLCYPPQWGWMTGDGNDREGCFRAPEFFDVPDWTPFSETFLGRPYDLAFVLHGNQAVPALEASWGAIKHLYGASTR
jgi:hypothetical protein